MIIKLLKAAGISTFMIIVGAIFAQLFKFVIQYVNIEYLLLFLIWVMVTAGTYFILFDKHK